MNITYHVVKFETGRPFEWIDFNSLEHKCIFQLPTVLVLNDTAKNEIVEQILTCPVEQDVDVDVYEVQQVKSTVDYNEKFKATNEVLPKDFPSEAFPLKHYFIVIAQDVRATVTEYFNENQVKLKELSREAFCLTTIK